MVNEITKESRASLHIQSELYNLVVSEKCLSPLLPSITDDFCPRYQPTPPCIYIKCIMT